MNSRKDHKHYAVKSTTKPPHVGGFATNLRSSNVQAFLSLTFASWNAVVDPAAILSFFRSHGFVAVPTGFTADCFFLSHCDQERWAWVMVLVWWALGIESFLCSCVFLVRPAGFSNSCRKCYLLR